MKNNKCMTATRIMLDFKVKRKYRWPIRADKNITGRIFLCGLWNQSHEINTSHSHLSHLLIYTILTKSNSFATFLGGGGTNIQDSKQEKQISPMQGNHCRSWTAPPGAKTSLHSFCPLTPLSFSPHATLGWSGLSAPLHTEWPTCSLALARQF